jgi:UDP-GlcNAc:undecaprenyl-phosphate GlcNAc-1-phosphate transferase
MEMTRRLLGILVAGGVVCIVGCIDDMLDIRPWQKVLGQVIAGLILVALHIRPRMGGLFDFIVDPLIVLVFVLGATNSLNLLDGLDGLCGGVTAIMAIAMLVLATLAGTVQDGSMGDPVRVIISLALLGGVCGFLPFNYHPARIFMGDAGSLLLGLIMAVLMIMFAEKGMQFWCASVAIFGLPILDTTIAFARRLINKRPLFVSDRGHIYDQMMDRGITLGKTVNLCYVLTAVYAAGGIAVSLMRPLGAFIACVAIAVVSLLVAWKKGYLRMTGLRGTVPQNSTHHSAGNRID